MTQTELPNNQNAVLWTRPIRARLPFRRCKQSDRKNGIDLIAPRMGVPRALNFYPGPLMKRDDLYFGHALSPA